MCRGSWRKSKHWSEYNSAETFFLNLQEFPPTSNLDSRLYGNQTSTITQDHVGNRLDGLTIDEVINRISFSSSDLHQFY